MPFVVSFKKLDPWLDVVIIGAELTRHVANINGACFADVDGDVAGGRCHRSWRRPLAPMDTCEGVRAIDLGADPLSYRRSFLPNFSLPFRNRLTPPASLDAAPRSPRPVGPRPATLHHLRHPRAPLPRSPAAQAPRRLHGSPATPSAALRHLLHPQPRTPSAARHHRWRPPVGRPRPSPPPSALALL
jgi:hypothetical protein